MSKNKTRYSFCAAEYKAAIRAAFVDGARYWHYRQTGTELFPLGEKEVAAEVDVVIARLEREGFVGGHARGGDSDCQTGD